MLRCHRFATLAAPFLALLLFASGASAQTASQPPERSINVRAVHPVSRTTEAIDENSTVVLAGNVHPLARPEFDSGAAPLEARMERMVLTLQPDAAQQQALEMLLAAQQDPESPEYHRWLTPEEFGRAYGISENDLRQVIDWLQQKGFAVEPVDESRRSLVFSGTVAQVQSAFHTEIHNYNVRGGMHRANVTEPEIPKALAPVVSGLVSLHDFTTKPLYQQKLFAAGWFPEFSSNVSHYLSPADFATIYNLAPLYSNATDGTGQSIAIVGRSNLALSDVQTFRSKFGLPANPPQVILNGPDPGILSLGEETEAELDVEWAGAVARNAAVQFVVSASTQTTDGVILSAQYIVNHNLAPVVSMSFGACEADLGAAGNQFFNSLWQQAAAQGMSVFVASGDSGAAGCDSPSANAGSGGQAVSGICASSFVTCVGGTQFSDLANPSQYWAATNNPNTLASALSYIPEAVWNTSGVVAGGSGLWSGGGGASSIYAKPAWQTGPGVPADGHRDVPDVALNSSTHDGYLTTINGQFAIVGGTSAATPTFAGLMALNVQRQGTRQGNINPVLYALAAKQAASGAQVFHDIVSGNNSVPNVTGYSAVAGYDLASGLGSVDANALVSHWTDGATPNPNFQLSESALSMSLMQGGTIAVTLSTAVSAGFSSAVSLAVNSLPAGLSATRSSPVIAAPGSGTSTLSLTASPQTSTGTYNLTVTATGGGVTQTAPLTVTIVSQCSYALNPASASLSGGAGSYSFAVTASPGCSWTAASNSNWISVPSGSSTTGSGKVSYSVAPNTAAASRTGAVNIAGLQFFIAQGGAAPTAFSVNPGTINVSAAAATGTFVLTAPSPTAVWTAVSNAAWLSVMNGNSGVGGKTITYSVAANTSNASRAGRITIGGQTFTVTQAGSGCTYNINVSPLLPTNGGFTGSVSVTTGPACSWTAASSVPWIGVASGASGTGNGSVKFSIAPDPSGVSRAGTLSVAGYSLTVTQGFRGAVQVSHRSPPSFR